mmetsp:Transcript_24989/g.31195  ORF Transcript_24989/g.31195 Transcript_24989/m.31195 type:complete len:371 (+) Transcript_24989:563-1675(+)
MSAFSKRKRTALDHSSRISAVEENHSTLEENLTNIETSVTNLSNSALKFNPTDGSIEIKNPNNTGSGSAGGGLIISQDATGAVSIKNTDTTTGSTLTLGTVGKHEAISIGRAGGAVRINSRYLGIFMGTGDDDGLTLSLDASSNNGEIILNEAQKHLYIGVKNAKEALKIASNGAITTTGNINGAPPLQMSYLSGVTSDIQTQLNLLGTSISGLPAPPQSSKHHILDFIITWDVEWSRDITIVDSVDWSDFLTLEGGANTYTAPFTGQITAAQLSFIDPPTDFNATGRRFRLRFGTDVRNYMDVPLIDTSGYSFSININTLSYEWLDFATVVDIPKNTLITLHMEEVINDSFTPKIPTGTKLRVSVLLEE